MKPATLQKLTLIAERVLRDQLLKLLQNHGASGWTITQVEGEGSRGVRATEWEGRNVQIDTLVSNETAEAIMEEVAAKYFEDWAVIVYSVEARVLRGGKYLPDE
jgi:nitrogen regulatory protein P-II 2